MLAAMSDESPYAGGCLCGAIRYEARAAPLRVNVCHCVQCRLQTGAPFAVWATFLEKDVTFIKGTPKTFKSSEKAKRSFCGACGTPLNWASTDRQPGQIDFSVCTLDAPERITPQYHLFTKSRIAWLDDIESLPKHPEWKD